MPDSVDIIIESDDWKSIDNIEDYCKEVVDRVLEHCRNDGEEVAILLTNDKKIRELNHQFKSKNSPTNVLSFPSDDQGNLGDIAICWEVVANEAEEQGKTAKDHFTHMLVHGILHLLGYDHEEDNDVEKMESIEVEILSNFNILNPYE